MIDDFGKLNFMEKLEEQPQTKSSQWNSVLCSMAGLHQLHRVLVRTLNAQTAGKPGHKPGNGQNYPLRLLLHFFLEPRHNVFCINKAIYKDLY